MLIGREKEQKQLLDAYKSSEPQVRVFHKI